jgi:sn1-specific diacylglycerol lipase
MTQNLIEVTKSFILTVILGDDIVPRLSLRSIHSLKANILKEIHECEMPKYRIVCNSALDYLFAKKNKNFYSRQNSSLLPNEIQNTAATSSRITIDDECHDIIEIVEDEIIDKQDESLIIQTKSEFVLQYSKNVLRSAFDTYEELNLPGRILCIYDLETRTSRCYPLCKGKQSFDFRWASSDEFKKIIITRRMLIDHFPNTLNDALKYFNREEII